LSDGSRAFTITDAVSGVNRQPLTRLPGAAMAMTVVIEEQIEIPLDLRSLADFRHWAASDAFPERGRIDYLAGRIEVDMSPEDLFCHGTLKGEIHGALHQIVKSRDLGYLFIDRARVSSVEADLSAEPDIVLVRYATLAAGRVRLIAKASGQADRYIELEGAPDLIVEIVSDASVGKDTKRLPAAYFKAGVPEFWLADARRQPVVFRIHERGRSRYRAVEPDREGFQFSPVLGCHFRLESHRDAQGHQVFDLHHRG
jgi:Uma2 family endonuclease